MQASAGFQTLHSPNNSLQPGQILPANVYTPGNSAGTDNSYYADLTFDHQVNKYFIHHLSLGHELELGLLGDQSDVYYANYTASWKASSFVNFAFTLSYRTCREAGRAWSMFRLTACSTRAFRPASPSPRASPGPSSTNSTTNLPRIVRKAIRRMRLV